MTEKEVLLRVQALFERALPKFNWGASFLDAEAIMLLNEVPLEVTARLREITDQVRLPVAVPADFKTLAGLDYCGYTGRLQWIAIAGGKVYPFSNEPPNAENFKHAISEGDYGWWTLDEYLREQEVSPRD